MARKCQITVIKGYSVSAQWVSVCVWVCVQSVVVLLLQLTCADTKRLDALMKSAVKSWARILAYGECASRTLPPLCVLKGLSGHLSVVHTCACVDLAYVFHLRHTRHEFIRLGARLCLFSMKSNVTAHGRHTIPVISTGPSVSHVNNASCSRICVCWGRCRHVWVFVYICRIK